MTDAIRPVILSGGTGARLWPVSRAGMAKQLLPLAGTRTLLQETLLRVAGQPGFLPAIVIGAHPVRFTLREQSEVVAPGTTIILEPARRDTMAAVMLAAVIEAREDPNRVLAVLPSDHLINDADAFRHTLHLAAAAVAHEGIAIIGVPPSEPSTAYGYISPGASLSSGALRVTAFVEKPDATTAARLIAEGCLWNAGLFCFRAGWLVEALRTVCQSDLALIESAVDRMRSDLGMLIPGDDFTAVTAISFDHGFMEKTKDAVVMPGPFRWSDLGDWNALWHASPKDSQGNATRGQVTALDAHNNLIRAESRSVAALSVDNLIIVETADAVMVASRDQAQGVKDLVATLIAAGRPEASEHVRTHRPWGWYQTMDLGERFRVKHIVVRPGAKLSLQRHHHRAEHWVVVRGTAEVTIDGTIRMLHENESTYIPMGIAHRLANPGKIAVEIIEVQTGTYLEEDDIERLEDDFGRL